MKRTWSGKPKTRGDRALTECRLARGCIIGVREAARDLADGTDPKAVKTAAADLVKFSDRALDFIEQSHSTMTKALVDAGLPLTLTPKRRPPGSDRRSQRAKKKGRRR